MTADVNVTEKVARALYVRTARDNATHDEAVVPWEELHPYQQDRWLSYAADVLGWLADPEVQAGIAGALAPFLDLPPDRRTWSDEERAAWEEHAVMSFTHGHEAALAVRRARVAAVVVEWLRGRA